LIKRLYILLFLLVILGAENKETYALDDLLAGADSFGRGSAYLAAEDNSSYVFQNYSLLGGQAAPRVTLTAFKLISEINYLAAAYSQDSWGIGLLNISDTGGYVRDERNNVSGGQIGYRNSILYGAYGREIRPDLRLGLRLKYHDIAFSEVESSAQGFALDVSGLHRLNKHLLLGGEINNLFAAPLIWSDGFQETQPVILGLGAQLKLLGTEGFWREAQPLNAYLDVRLKTLDAFWNGGLEYWPSEYIALRAGFKQTASEPTDTYQYTAHTRFTAGIGFNWHNIFIDYAYNPGDDLAENITHFFTLSYRFPEKAEPVPEPEPEPPPVVPPRRQRIFFDTTHLRIGEQILLEDLGYLSFVQGYPPGGIYAPDQAMTRRELMIVLVRLLESAERHPEGAPLVFPDTTTRNKELTDKAAGYGLLVGYPDGLARLDDPARRDEAACAFARYYEIAGRNLLNTDVYADVPLEHWGYKDINLTRQYYLTQGIDTLHYIPGAYLSRLDAARILGRIKYVRDSRSGLPPIEGLSELLAEEETIEALLDAEIQASF
jgi:hypothetical protein